MKTPDVEIAAAVEQDGPGILQVSSGISLFSPEEVACVQELWQEYLKNDTSPDRYYFLAARQAGQVVGFACYGRRPLTESTYDLYWIAVDQQRHQQGIGAATLRQVEKAILAIRGTLLIVETSGDEKYAPTRRFYESQGYKLEANILDFYKPGESLVIYSLHLI